MNPQCPLHEHFEMRSVQRVFVFGAGASHGTRDQHPPMGKGLHRYVRQYLCKAREELTNLENGDRAIVPDVRRTLKVLLDRASSFESLVCDIRREKEKDPLLSKLNLLMASALTPPISSDPRVDDVFVEKVDTYDHLLAIIHPKDGRLGETSFISFNYDCLLERAICRHLSKPLAGQGQCLCKHVDYHLSDHPSDDPEIVEVLKPHGSINWVADVTLGDGRIPPNAPVPIAGRYEPGDVFTWVNVNAVASPIGQGHEEIVLAHYAPGKEAQANPDTLLKIRRIACERIFRAKFITIIGLHLPTDPAEDPFLSDFLEAMRKAVGAGEAHVVFVNPDASESEKARSHFGFDASRKTFADYVSDL